MSFIELLELLIRDAVLFVPELSHVQTDKLAILATLCKSRRRTGMVAYVLPLRFKGGSPVRVVHRGASAYHYCIQPVFSDGREVLYSIHFLIPRFLRLTLREKIETVIHELYHIHPDCNGDLRRFSGGRLHGPTDREYGMKVRLMTEGYLDGGVGSRIKPLGLLAPAHSSGWIGSIPVRRRLAGSCPKLLKVETKSLLSTDY